MKNQDIYDEYSIQGWLCHFFTEEAKEKYNTKVKKYCEELEENATDLTLLQKIRHNLYIYFLDVYDVFKNMF